MGPLLLKLMIIGLVALLLGVMLEQVADLVHEREARYQDVNREIGSLWGGDQTLEGPLLAIPYGRPAQVTGAGTIPQAGVLYFLPEQLEVKAGVEPQLRHRGLFQSVVYSLDTHLKARFLLPTRADLDAVVDDAGDDEIVLLWESAFIALGVSDMRSIGDLVELQAGSERLPFVPGSRVPDLLPSGMSVNLPVDVDVFNRGMLDVVIDLKLNGSGAVNVLPLGRQTRVEIESTWPSPKFIGAYLPESREIDAGGFTARWSLSYFGRDYGQVLHSEHLSDSVRSQLRASAFGVELYQPVTPYRKVERAIKYGLLFVVFTFGLYFIIELVTGRRIHPVQYATVGVPLCLFYLMLVAFAEHIGFVPAYVLGASSIIALIGLYSLSVLRGLRKALLIMLSLVGLYGYLYTLLEQESYSLLWGSLGLLLLTAGFMYGTRNVDWYASETRSGDGGTADQEEFNHA
ncbi:MAG: cell envelope integrity protein CreD [Gammaproteobacteria bacterium]|nr:cell envelope integrity protein CreD [Gammaproteobacteria bacterium]